MNKKFSNCKEAIHAFNTWKVFLDYNQQDRLFNSHILKDGDEYQILSGSDLLFDHAGFGSTIAAAIEDYVHCYIRTT